MATLEAGDLADLIAMTLPELGRNRWTEIATDLQDHIAMNQILRKERVGFGSGDQIDFNLQVTEGGNAKNAGLYEQDQLNVPEVMQVGTVPWRHSQTHWAIERREVAMNRTPARIVELMKIRRADAMISLAELMETNFWGKPSASTDKLTPYGVDYWFIKEDDTTGLFTTDLPAGFSDVAGVVPATYDRWANYTVQYTSVTKEDLVRKWRKSATFTDFKNPVPIPTYNTGDRYGYYTNYDVIGPLEEALEAQNDNLGNDIASKDGKLMFRGNPIVWVPQLESDTSDPVYGINWGTFRVHFLRGEYLREDGPRTAPLHHTVVQVFVDLTYNFVCRNRRKNFILHTGA